MEGHPTTISEGNKADLTLLKRVKKTGGDAYEKKSEKNSKVNLGGPGKRTPRKTASRNRGIERKRDEKKKKK